MAVMLKDHGVISILYKLLPYLLEFTAPDRTSSIFCKVYFAEEFQQLREMVFPSGEDRSVDRGGSTTHCQVWGGGDAYCGSMHIHIVSMCLHVYIYTLYNEQVYSVAVTLCQV